jgi:predicted P-loop ATPase/GTPase
MNILDVLSLKSSDQEFFNAMILTEDGGIHSWYLEEHPVNSNEFDLWVSDAPVNSKYTKQINDIINKNILKELLEIDTKSIRALRTNDTARLAQLESQAAAFRLKLSN